MTFTPTVPARSLRTGLLLAHLDEHTDLLVGDGVKPAGSGWQGAPGASEFVAYLILHSIPGGQLDGSLGDPSSEASWPWQVTAVGAVRHQCEDAQDTGRVALLTIPIDHPCARRVYVDAAGGARVDETVDPNVFISTERYRFDTTPAE